MPTIATAMNHAHGSVDAAGGTVTPMLGTSTGTGTGPSTGRGGGADTGGGTAAGRPLPGVDAGGRLMCTGVPGRFTPWVSATPCAEGTAPVPAGTRLVELAVAAPAAGRRSPVAVLGAAAPPGANPGAPGRALAADIAAPLPCRDPSLLQALLP